MAKFSLKKKPIALVPKAAPPTPPAEVDETETEEQGEDDETAEAEAETETEEETAEAEAPAPAAKLAAKALLKGFGGKPQVVIAKGAKPAPGKAGKVAVAKPTWVKWGSDAKAALAREQKAAEQRREQYNKPRRFYLRPGEEAKITFLDGALLTSDEEKDLLAVPLFKEHEVSRAGQKVPDHYVCIEDIEGVCPLCRAENFASYVALLRILDHRIVQTQRQTYQDELRLFVCKRETLGKLQKKAIKLGGLVGCTFDVSRSSDQRSAKVGDDFEFVVRHTLEELAGHFDTDGKKGLLTPLAVEEVVNYLSAQEMAQLGLGPMPKVEGAVAKPTKKSTPSDGDEAVPTDEDILPF